MVNLIIINEESITKIEHQKIQEVMESVFRYTQEVNIHLIINLIPPTNTLGIYDYFFFIEIPYRSGNYFHTQNNVYLNNIVFAVRKITDNHILKVTNKELLTAIGAFNYEEQIEKEKKALKEFIYNNIPSIKFIDLAIYYSLDAPNCPQKEFIGNLLCNVPRNMYKLVTKTIDDLKRNEKWTSCIYMKNKFNLSNIVSSFINAINSKTNYGILTKKKMDAISTKIIGKQMQTLYDSAGQKLEIITGKAGTGKSLALLRFMYNYVQKHHCRLLTFNNLLVMDTTMTLKNIGKYNNSNASVSTLHKFFYNLYIRTPVKALHMDENQINRLFNICQKRVLTTVVLIERYATAYGFTKDTELILKYYKDKNIVDESDKKEMEYFCRYLHQQNNFSLNTLREIATQYIEEKRTKFIKLYSLSPFLSGYRIIMEQLYLLFHNCNDFF